MCGDPFYRYRIVYADSNRICEGYESAKGIELETFKKYLKEGKFENLLTRKIDFNLLSCAMKEAILEVRSCFVAWRNPEEPEYASLKKEHIMADISLKGLMFPEVDEMLQLHCFLSDLNALKKMKVAESHDEVLLLKPCVISLFDFHNYNEKYKEMVELEVSEWAADMYEKKEIQDKIMAIKFPLELKQKQKAVEVERER